MTIRRDICRKSQCGCDSAQENESAIISVGDISFNPDHSKSSFKYVLKYYGELYPLITSDPESLNKLNIALENNKNLLVRYGKVLTSREVNVRAAWSIINAVEKGTCDVIEVPRCLS